ncbi:MAG: heavy metal-binding domain-containing protein, partial [Dokdonella sp.]
HQDDIVLVTGSNGRIGSAVMQRLRRRFDNVVGLDRKAPGPPPPDCVAIPVDITSDESMREGLRVLRAHHGARIATVVHLAAYYDFLGKPSPLYEQVTVEGTRRLLRGLQDGFEVGQFIFASTMLVHRPGEPGLLITEDSPIGPTWAYPKSKVRTEDVINNERGAISTVILRLAGVYDDDCHSPPLAHQIQRIYERQLAGHLYSGETSHGQSFVHMDDVVDAVELAVDRHATLPAESVVLIGEPETLSYDELQHSFSRLIHGESWETHNVPRVIAKTGAWLQDQIPGQDPFIKPWMIDRANDHYALDITRAHALLNWVPQHSLRETLPKMVAALKADPIAWYREQGLEPTSSMKKQAANSDASTVDADVPTVPSTHTCPMHPEVSQSSSGNCPRCGLPLESAASEQAQAQAKPTEYTCPMHPEVVSDEPGPCPKCGMPLELRSATTATDGGSVAESHAVHEATKPASQAAEYTCPMHPEVERSEPGKCPKCGMTLVPRGSADAGSDGHDGHKTHDAHGGHGSGDMMVDDHRKMLWPHYLVMMLGAWLLTSPFTLGYLSDFVPDANQLRVMSERGLSSFELRNLLMTWSDVLSGLLVIIFGALSADAGRRHPWAQWANAFVGLWLLFAPLLFWTPLPEAYANGTLVGGLVIALSVLIPMMPGMSMAGMMGGPDVPAGWAYTPSSWLQRMPIGVLALIGFLISRVLGAYQLGHIDSAWDPFFAGSGAMRGVMNGTETIITSDMSKAWPIADGALGGIVYMLELVMVWMGMKTRWRTMPWMVLALAILILPLGVVSIYFVIIQPIAIGTWCTLCLIAALAMAVMIPYALNEFVAMGQFLAWSRKQGKPFWRTFWTGDAMDGGDADTSKGLVASTREQWAQATRGVTYPWTLMLSIAIGVWLPFTRVVFDSAGAMANSDHVVGLLILTFTIIALAEVGRATRFINIPFGAWLIAAPWLLEGVASPLATWNSVISGLLLIALALPRGTIKDSYAGWSRYIV